MQSWEALIHVCHTLSPLVLEHMGTSLMITHPCIPIPASPSLACSCGCDSRFAKEGVSWLENQKNPQSAGAWRILGRPGRLQGFYLGCSVRIIPVSTALQAQVDTGL